MTLEVMLSVIAIAAALAGALSIVLASWKNGISPMPSSAPVRRAVAAEIGRIASMRKDAVAVVDAGAGWGTLAFHLVRHCPVRTVTGIENSTVPLLASRLTARLNRRANGPVSFEKGDLYRYPYETSDVVVCYLHPGAMKRLDAIFRSRLSPGARVVSVCFALPGWQPERVVVCGDPQRTKVYVYARPEKETLSGSAS